MSLRAVQGLQVAISIYADKGLLDKSTVVRIRLRRRATPDTGVRAVVPPSADQPLEFDEMLEFPSEHTLVSGSSRPRPAGRLPSMLRVSTLVAFAAGVAVGASSGRLDGNMPTLPAVNAPRPPARPPAAVAQPAPAPPEVLDDLLVLGRAWTPEDEHLADVLHSRSIGSGAQLIDQSLALGAVAGTKPDFE